MKIKLEDLKNTAREAILKYGYDEQEANSILEVMLYAQLRGNNQGVVKLIGAGIPKSPEAGEIKIEKETKVSAHIDGAKNHSMVVVNFATETAISKAKQSGIAVVGVHNIETSSGAIGYYARKIAREGLIGFIYSGSSETVAPFGSYEPILGTNPIAFAVPTSGEPMVLDMATAAMAYFGLVEAKTAGTKLPADIAYDKDGNLTIDPAEAIDGALRTFDKGHKGFGLSLMVQILAGPLVGASYPGNGGMDTNWAGHLVLAFDPELLGGLEAVKKGVDTIIKQVKDAKKLPGVEEIIIPGERGDTMAKEAWDSGEIEIEDNLYNELLKVAG